jgi:hypothetical protein
LTLQKHVFKNGRDANSVLLTKTTAAGKHGGTVAESRALNIINNEK